MPSVLQELNWALQFRREVFIMKSSFFLSSLFVATVAVACGREETETVRSASQTNTSGDSSSTASVTFNGSVTSAFAITVDGVRYDDSEDFYTQEVQRLPEKAAAAGYAGWETKFDAVLGFSDLSRDMVVYISPTEKRGYTGKASVGSDAKFRVELPSGAQDSSYNVRAVKRVNVILSKDGESKKFCYNFSAVDKNVPFNEKDKPIVLDSFTSKLTLYACESQQSDGIVIPAAQ
jgi:hypothetical protein